MDTSRDWHRSGAEILTGACVLGRVSSAFSDPSFGSTVVKSGWHWHVCEVHMVLHLSRPIKLRVLSAAFVYFWDSCVFLQIPWNSTLKIQAKVVYCRAFHVTQHLDT